MTTVVAAAAFAVSAAAGAPARIVLSNPGDYLHNAKPDDDVSAR